MLDIIIIIFIIIGILLGLKRGFTREVVEALGFIAVIVLAYLFKNPVSTFLLEKFPFFKFGVIKNIEIINIIFYEIIAFIICVIVLIIILKLLAKFTTLFEKFLNATVILGIPSKIAGAIVGGIYHFIITFVALYLLNIFLPNTDFLLKSKMKDPILNKTPILSSVIDKGAAVISEFNVLKEKYNDSSISEDEFNYQAVELFLKYKVVKPTTLENLIANKKINSFENCLELINKYKENNNGN